MKILNKMKYNRDENQLIEEMKNVFSKQGNNDIDKYKLKWITHFLFDRNTSHIQILNIIYDIINDNETKNSDKNTALKLLVELNKIYHGTTDEYNEIIEDIPQLTNDEREKEIKRLIDDKSESDEKPERSEGFSDDEISKEQEQVKSKSEEIYEKILSFCESSTNPDIQIIRFKSNNEEQSDEYEKPERSEGFVDEEQSDEYENK